MGMWDRVYQLNWDHSNRYYMYVNIYYRPYICVWDCMDAPYYKESGDHESNHPV